MKTIRFPSSHLSLRSVRSRTQNWRSFENFWTPQKRRGKGETDDCPGTVSLGVDLVAGHHTSSWNRRSDGRRRALTFVALPKEGPGKGSPCLLFAHFTQVLYPRRISYTSIPHRGEPTNRFDRVLSSQPRSETSPPIFSCVPRSENSAKPRHSNTGGELHILPAPITSAGPKRPRGYCATP